MSSRSQEVAADYLRDAQDLLAPGVLPHQIRNDVESRRHIDNVREYVRLALEALTSDNSEGM